MISSCYSLLYLKLLFCSIASGKTASLSLVVKYSLEIERLNKIRCQLVVMVTMCANALKSVRCDVDSHVAFVSQTERKAAVYWIDYMGTRVRYAILNYGNTYQVNTFETHPWIFCDAETGDRLVTDSLSDVYWPQPWNGFDTDTVYIRIPVYSLKERSLQVVRQTLTREDIETADIPTSLKRDLLDQDSVSCRVYQHHSP